MRKLFAVAAGAGAHSKTGKSLAEILQKNFGIVDIGINLGSSDWSNGLDFVELELVRHLFDDFGLDGPLLLDKAVYERMFTQEIDDAWNPQRVDMNGFNRLCAENWFARSAGNPEAFHNVIPCLLFGKRSSSAAKHDALPELAKLGELKLLFQFRLAGEDDLQKLFGGGLQVREKPDFLQHGISKILCFVDDQDDRFPVAVAFEQPVIELEKLLALGFGLAGNIEFGEDEIEELAGIHAGVEKESGTRPTVMQPVEQTIDQCGLAGADFAGKSDEAFAGLNAVHQAGQGFLDLLGEKEKARIGVDVERVFFKTVKAFVH